MSNIQTIKKSIQTWKPVIEKVINDTVNPEKFIQVVQILMYQNPTLQQCSIESVIGAIIQASIIGLDLTPMLGQAYILPFKSMATYMFGYRGLCTLMYNSGEVKKIVAHVIRKNDKYDFDLLSENQIKHHKWTIGENRGEIIAVYAGIKLINGEWIFTEPIDSETIYKLHRDRSPAKDSKYSPWNDKWTEPAMFCKCAIKHLSKFAPFSLNLQRNIAADQTIITPDKFIPEKSGAKLDLSSIDYAYENEIESEKTDKVGELKKKAAEKAEKINAKTSGKAKKETIDEETGEIIEETAPPDVRDVFIQEWCLTSDSDRLSEFIKIKKKFDLEKYCTDNKLKVTKNFSDLKMEQQAAVLWECNNQ